MTRPGYAMVELPIEEAESLLEESKDSTGALWNVGRLGGVCLHLIEQAIRVERGPGGNSQEPAPDVEQVGEAA